MIVMAGLEPAIHVLTDSSAREIRFANLFRNLRFFFNGAL
jgi:hypothetical protein